MSDVLADDSALEATSEVDAIDVEEVKRDTDAFFAMAGYKDFLRHARKLLSNAGEARAADMVTYYFRTRGIDEESLSHALAALRSLSHQPQGE